jgi:hypothetical protein
MAQRALVSRLVLASFAMGFAYVNVVSCSGSDSTKHVMDEGGGEGGEPSSSGNNSGGSKAGSAGNGAKAGNGGTLPVELGGAAGEGPAPTSGTGGTGGSGGAGGSAPAGGSGGEAGAPEAGAAGTGGASGASGAAGAPAECQTDTVATRISIAFDANNAERVTGLTWVDSTNTKIANVAAQGGASRCNDFSEFFGESYGAPEGTTPNVIVAGSLSTAQFCGSDFLIKSTPIDCGGLAQIPTQTEYHFYEGAKASQMRVTRSIGFNADTPVYTGTGVRVWQPRVVLATFDNVIYPNAAETAVTKTATQSCPGDCLIPTGATWSGRWFADIAQSGLAIIVVRDPAMTDPVDLTINYDSYSSSNLTSFVHLQPQNGWKAPIAEVEYLCFADFTSWPQAERDAAKLPAFCGP